MKIRVRISRKRKSPSHKQKGVVLYLVAAGCFVFLAFAGLVMDLGMLYNVKTDLQNAVDAAAFAGASQLNGTTQGITDAMNEAIAAGNKYYFKNTAVGIVDSDVTFSTTRDSGYVAAGSVSDPGVIRFVKVSSQKTMPLAFMTIMGWVSSNVPAYAVAGQTPPINQVCDGLVPFLRNR